MYKEMLLTARRDYPNNISNTISNSNSSASSRIR